MKHFLATRFNLKTPQWKTTKSGNLVLTNEWLNHRFHIFENYCLPSVKNQSSLNFKWCIFFDIDTPDEYKQKIFAISEEFPVIFPIFIESMEKLRETFKDFINNNIDKNDSHIITTRIDNDDIIHQDFVEIIQFLFKPKDLAVIDLQKGYQVSIDTINPEVRLYTHRFNSFISVIECTKSFNTVFSRMHYEWENEKNIISYNRKRLWMELSHQENFVNHRQIRLKKAYYYDKIKFILPIEFQIDVLDALQTNLKIYSDEIISILKRKVRFLSKIPFRAKRYLLRKIK